MSSADWSIYIVFEEKIPVIPVLDATNCCSVLQLTRSLISPIGYTQKYRQQTGPRTEGSIVLTGEFGLLRAKYRQRFAIRQVSNITCAIFVGIHQRNDFPKKDAKVIYYSSFQCAKYRARLLTISNITHITSGICMVAGRDLTGYFFAIIGIKLCKIFPIGQKSNVPWK